MDNRPDLPRFYKPMRDPLPPEFYGEQHRSDLPAQPDASVPTGGIREDDRRSPLASDERSGYPASAGSVSGAKSSDCRF